MVRSCGRARSDKDTFCTGGKKGRPTFTDLDLLKANPSSLLLSSAELSPDVDCFVSLRDSVRIKNPILAELHKYAAGSRFKPSCDRASAEGRLRECRRGCGGLPAHSGKRHEGRAHPPHGPADCALLRPARCGDLPQEGPGGGSAGWPALLHSSCAVMLGRPEQSPWHCCRSEQP